MHIFYTPNIEQIQELPEEESQHCVKVLRLNEGDEICLTDGKGKFFKAEISLAHAKRCGVRILETIPTPPSWPCRIHLAIAPTKNMDRIEWLTEKCTEIGIDEITLLRCRFSERKEVKNERLQKILVSAMKQSLKATLPVLSGVIDFKQFIKQPFSGQKFIAHCYTEMDKQIIKDLYKKGEDVTVLIGPEGDFSPEEVTLALENGYQPISLGESRLRTETAGVVACHTIHVINQ